jgi:hypothetical protein
MLFLTAIGAARDEGYSKSVLHSILGCAKEQGVNLILVEPNYGDGMFAQLLRAEAQTLYPVTVEDSPWAKGQKEAQIIDTLEPIMNQHRLVVCRSVIEKDYSSTTGYAQEDINAMRLFYQMTRITRQRGALKHDDRLDALAGAVAYWVEFMSRNTEKAVEQRKEDLLTAELDRFMSNALGSSLRSSPRFF